MALVSIGPSPRVSRASSSSQWGLKRMKSIISAQLPATSGAMNPHSSAATAMVSYRRWWRIHSRSRNFCTRARSEGPPTRPWPSRAASTAASACSRRGLLGQAEDLAGGGIDRLDLLLGADFLAADDHRDLEVLRDPLQRGLEGVPLGVIPPKLTSGWFFGFWTEIFVIPWLLFPGGAPPFSSHPRPRSAIRTRPASPDCRGEPDKAVYIINRERIPS